jgi:hypothetical protein
LDPSIQISGIAAGIYFTAVFAAVLSLLLPKKINLFFSTWRSTANFEDPEE